MAAHNVLDQRLFIFFASLYFLDELYSFYFCFIFVDGFYLWFRNMFLIILSADVPESLQKYIV